MNTISAVRDAVLATRGPVELAMLSMRIMLATGISLKDPKADVDADPASVRRVKQALGEMGVVV